MPNFYEALEGRMFLSAAPLTVGQPLLVSSAALVQPLVTTVSIPGRYTGNIVVTGIHARPVTLTLARRTATRFVGTLTATQDPTIRVPTVVRVTGQAANGRRFITITFNGTHGNGAIVGTGAGVITATGRLKVLNFVFVQNNQPFPGTVVLTKG